MPPQSPQPAPPPFVPQPGGSNPYHFILNPEPPKKRNPLLPTGNTLKGRILLVAGGAFVLLMIVWIVGSIISNASQSGTQELIDLTARQQELIRVSQLGVTSAKNQDTQDMAITAQLALSTDQQQLLAILRKSNIKVGKAQLNSHKNSQTDLTLTQAGQTNQFDGVFVRTFDDELISYQKAIKTAFDANSGKTARALLTTEFNNASALLGPSQPK